MSNMKLIKSILILTEEKELNRTVLNKLLFFSDLAYFLKSGKGITEAAYLKLPYGPVPETIDIARSILLSNNLLYERKYSYPLYIEYGYKATNNVNFDIVKNDFNVEQLNILRNVIDNLSVLTATSLSQKSHEFEPWRSTENWYEKLDFTKAKQDNKLEKWLSEMKIVTF